MRPSNPPRTLSFRGRFGRRSAYCEGDRASAPGRRLLRSARSDRAAAAAPSASTRVTVARNRKRPRVALVAHEVSGQQGSGRVIKELIHRASNRVDFVVVSRQLATDLRPLVEWRRAPAPGTPHKLKYGIFFLTGAVQLLGARVDLVHVHASGPTVPNRADVTSVHLSRAGWFEALGILGPDGLPRYKQLSPRIHVAVERWCFRRSRILAGVSSAEKAVLERLYPGPPVVVTPNGVDVNRFRPAPAVRAEVRAAEGS